jgi:hypothetical protein
MHTIYRLNRHVLLAAVAVTVVSFSSSAFALTFSEGFDTGVPSSWSQQNNSSPAGPATWTQGVAALSPAHSGTVDSFIVVNFQSGAGVATISNWLWTPTLTVSPSSQLIFYTRTASNPSSFPDRLEVRWSDAAVPSPGTTATDVGTFSTLLLTVNPDLTSTAFPAAWTAYTYDFSALTAPSTGNLAFRYFVSNGGPSGNNSSIIGLDTLSITNAVPEPGTYVLMTMGLLALSFLAKRSRRG